MIREQSKCGIIYSKMHKFNLKKFFLNEMTYQTEVAKVIRLFIFVNILDKFHFAQFPLK